MHMNRSALEKPHQLASSTSDHVRSYRCTFCRRDFSNAQALGGHMNIHRRDRAKLKGSSDETLFSRDHDFKKNDASSPPKASSNYESMQDISEENGVIDYKKSCCAHKRTLSLSEEDEESPAKKYGYKDVRQLPFFVEKSYATNDFGTKSFFGGGVEKKHGSSSLDLDLELRLGPEPQD